MKSPPLSNNRNRRNRQFQPEQQVEQEPFFSKAGKNNLQQKPKPFFQPKSDAARDGKGVTTGKPGDHYEREADAVADAVVNRQSGQQPVVQRQPITPLSGSGGLQRLATPDEEKMPGTNDARMEEDKAIQQKPEVQRQEVPKEEEKPVQMMGEEEEEPVQAMGEPGKEEEKPVQMMGEEEEEPVQAKEEEEEPVQTKAQPGPRPASADLGSKLSQHKGNGNPLPQSVRSEMEHSFGADFSGVNIHTDSEAVQMNRELHAHAFTHGQDVYFNSGKFAPENTEGKHLLAHELTHTLQQSALSTKSAVQAKSSKSSTSKKSWKTQKEKTVYVLRDAHNGIPAGATVYIAEWPESGNEALVAYNIGILPIPLIFNWIPKHALVPARQKLTSDEYKKLLKLSGSKKKELAKEMISPGGSKSGQGGWLEYNDANLKRFLAYFSSSMPGSLRPIDLTILSSTMSANNPDFRELPPEDLWPNMKQTLALVKKLGSESGTDFSVWSAYRSDKVNALSGGAASSAHMDFYGLDLKPLGDQKKFEAFVKHYWHQQGHGEGFGLGFYSRDRVHIDARSYRRWAGSWESESASTSFKRYKKFFSTPLQDVQQEWSTAIGGYWKGVYQAGKTKYDIDVLLFNPISNVFWGLFGYTDGKGNQVAGYLYPKDIKYKTSGSGRVNGVELSFYWLEGTNTGNMYLTGKDKNNLKGSWGYGSSVKDKGALKLEKH